MLNDAPTPELKEILGSLILSSRHPVSAGQLRESLVKAAAECGAEAAAFKQVRETDITAALQTLAVEFKTARCGVELAEVAGGFRFQTAPSCGTWVRCHLEAGRTARLSKPCLETLAIIAYRQPISRSEIEGIRGVNVDHVVKTLLEAQLIRIVGRSELPGRPFQYGTTHAFLEYFGLKDIKDLASVDPMLFRQKATPAPAGKPTPQEQAPKPAAEDSNTEAPEVAPTPAQEPPANANADDDDVEEFEEDEYDDDEDDDEDDEDEEEVEEEEADGEDNAGDEDGGGKQ